MVRSLILALLLLASPAGSAQDHAAMAAKPAAKPSSSLTVTGLDGKTVTLTPAHFKALPHVTVAVHNAHNSKDESYSGVPVSALLAMVQPAKGEGPKVSTNMLLVVAGATDDFHVAITFCDTNPECRSGQALVADVQDGKPIEADGAFKLILTEDKKPARWARNLQSLTVKPAL